MENNEFFSMLLNFDNGFQSVPDILRTSSSMNNHPHDVILNNRPPPSKNAQNNHYNDFSEQTYPLDMQFPNVLRTPEKDKEYKEVESPVQKSTKSTKSKAATSKKRKQASSPLENEQSLKMQKSNSNNSNSNNNTSNNNSNSLNSLNNLNSSNSDDYDDLDNSDHDENSKRQRRLVKNREAAQMFRQRQKAYIQNLEKKVNDLNFENQQHRSKVELLTTENRLLADQLNYLRTFVSGIVSMSFPGHQNIANMLPSFDQNANHRLDPSYPPATRHFNSSQIAHLPKDKN